MGYVGAEDHPTYSMSIFECSIQVEPRNYRTAADSLQLDLCSQISIVARVTEYGCQVRLSSLHSEAGNSQERSSPH